MALARSIMVGLLLASVAAHARDVQHELLVFGSGELVSLSNREMREADINRDKVSADILFSLQSSSLQLFGEYLVSNHEADLERFQLGWQPTADTTVWLGRFHQPGSAWNHDHHHGQFLQTSVTRPAIDNWEDDGGILPQHFTGALVESGWHLRGDSAIHAALGAGIAPIITEDGLEAYDLLKPNGPPHRLGFQARIGFLPDEFEDTGVGIAAARAELAAHPQTASGLDHAELTLIGVYGSGDPWCCKLSGAAYYVSSRLVGALEPAVSDHFFIGYLQIEKSLPKQVVLFARHEDASRASQAKYLDLFPDFAATRSIAGIRWEFAGRQALTLQGAKSHTVTGVSYHDVRVQWSAALF